ncbi:MAG: Ribonuclease [Cyanobacteriota bacterium]
MNLDSHHQGLRGIDHPDWWLQHHQLGGDRLVAGVDEVGRGAIFGPVVAAAVLLPITAIAQLRSLGVKDSKKLSSSQRETLVVSLSTTLTAYHISFADVPTIDKQNIRQASLLAMARSIRGLPTCPAHLLVDGRDPLPGLPIPQTAVIQGDSHSAIIGAASILAKVWRDRLIVRLATRFPGYDLANNKGYGTARHRQGLRQLGKTPLHRTLFCRKILI